MNDGATSEASAPVRSRNRERLVNSATLALCIALLCNVAWIGFLSWLVIRTAQLVVSRL